MRRTIAATALVVLACSLSSPALTSDWTTIGRFQVRDLAGWQKRVYRGALISAVTYSSNVSEARVTAKFALTRTPRGVKPPSAATLAQAERDRRRVFAAMERETNGWRCRTIRSLSTRYRKWPAHLIVLRFEAPSEQPSLSTNLRFTDARDLYMFSVHRAARSPSPRVQRAAEEAFREMQTSLRIAPGRARTRR